MSASGGVDIRIPMGLMFTIIGAVIAIFGAVTNKDPMYAHSMDVNINLWWGLIMAAFGLVMLLLAWLASGASNTTPDQSAAQPPHQPGH